MSFPKLGSAADVSRQWLTRTRKNAEAKQSWNRNPMPMLLTPKDAPQLPLVVPHEWRSVAIPVTRLIRALDFRRTGQMPVGVSLHKGDKALARQQGRTLSTSSKGLSEKKEPLFPWTSQEAEAKAKSKERANWFNHHEEMVNGKTKELNPFRMPE